MRFMRPGVFVAAGSALVGAGLFAPPVHSTAPVATRPAASQVRGVATTTSSLPTVLRISTFNLLGSQHTVAYGGDEPWMAPGPVRADWASDVIRGMGSDIVGFDEMQNDQLAKLTQTFPDYTIWPAMKLGGSGRPTSLMWRSSKFTVLATSYVTIPFLSQQRKMPIVKLRDNQTGRAFYVFNAHNGPAGRQSQRNQDLSIEIAKIHQLRQSGLPVFFIGDLNEHETAFCPVVAKTDLTSPAGGSATSTSCSPPRGMRIDWIFGNVGWSNYVVSRSPLVARATDHAVLVATANFG